MENNQEFEDLIDLEDNSSDDAKALAQFPEQQQSQNNTHNVTQDQSWDFRSKLAQFETEKEFSIFSFWLESGRGRSKQHTAKVFNLTDSAMIKLSAKNNWDLRAADYDRYQLQLMVAADNTARAEEHKRKLEEYRMQQEFIGQSLSSDAAKIAALVSGTLNRMLEESTRIGVRDLPMLLNAANKAAEVGRNLQSSALGVDQLLTALEEVDDQ